MSLNLVLGHSVRSAQTSMDRSKDSAIVCVVSPSPRAARRMDDDGLYETFDSIATTMRQMKRLEVHFYASNRIWLPTRALTNLLRKSAPCLQYLLLNGMRFHGTVAEMEELGTVFQQQPSLLRICFFNIASLDPENVPLHPMVTALRLNPQIQDVAFRYTHWSSGAMSTVCDAMSQIKVLRLTGKDILGPGGMDMPAIMYSLGSNTSLREVRINQCPLPLGTGQLVAEMLEANTTLETLNIEVICFSDAVPMAKALGRGNKTLKTLDIFVAQHRSKPRTWRVAGAGNDIDAEEEQDDEDEEVGELPEDPNVTLAKSAFESTLESNCRLEQLVLNTPTATHITPQIELFLRMNRCGRGDILQNDHVEPDEVLGFLERYSSETSMIWYFLRMKPDLFQLLATAKSPVAAAGKPAAAGKKPAAKRQDKAFAKTVAAARGTNTAAATIARAARAAKRNNTNRSPTASSPHGKRAAVVSLSPQKRPRRIREG